MDTFRVGVTGIGYMGQLEARICASMGGFEVVGLHNRSREKAEALAEELSCSAHDSLEELVAVPELDALIIATPNNVHLEPVLQAAGRGLHIFLEKPMGLNVAECRRMSAAAEDAGVVLFMGHPQRFMDGLRRVRRIVAEGVIGRPVALRVERFFWVDSHHSAPSWKTQRETSGGHLFHHMHELDTARWILGEVETVYGQMANLAHPDAGDAGEDDVVQVSARYRQGTLGTFELGSAYRTRSHTLRIDGTEGTVLSTGPPRAAPSPLPLSMAPPRTRCTMTRPVCSRRPRCMPRSIAAGCTAATSGGRRCFCAQWWSASLRPSTGSCRARVSSRTCWT